MHYLFSFLLISSICHASLFNDLKSWVTDKLISHERVETKGLVLPPFPEVTKDPKDASGMSIVESEFKHPFYQKLNDQQKEQLSIQFLSEVYQVVLNREPQSYEINGKMNILLQGASREGVYRSIVLSDDYRKLEQTGTQANETAIKFIKSFLQNFVNVDLDIDKMKQVSVYTLKRVTIEKAFELYSAYPNDKERQIWFALFSHELGVHYANVFEKNYRKFPEPSYYLKWAEQMPNDIVLAEIALKLHKLINFIQLNM